MAYDFGVKDYDSKSLASWQWDEEVETKALHKEGHVCEGGSQRVSRN